MAKMIHILLNYNQPTYLKQAILWFRWYYPDVDLVVLDNNSDNWEAVSCDVVRCEKNDCAGNLRDFIDQEVKDKYDYYGISDVDVMPHPSTPPYFLEVFKHLIDTGFHHAGFGLQWEDIPDWNHEKTFIQNNESKFSTPQNGAPAEHILNKGTGQLIPVSQFQSYDFCKAMCDRNPETYQLVNEQVSNIYEFKYEGEPMAGFRAPIDTTFALYSTKNSGWSAPMPPKDWDNSIRIFKSFHLSWYLHPGYINAEMEHYFKTARYWEPGEISAGINHNRPLQYQKNED